ncbi:amidohydrolase [Silanimonas sp.]|jgi:predicted amidohydrolase YtcJ|uniref:amidohydrolase n=1 Tax=Silanimonas sp. TaxID=1929290 RepID=UPI0037C90D1E
MRRLALSSLILATLALPACAPPSNEATTATSPATATPTVHLLVAARIAASDNADANAMAWDDTGHIIAIGRAEDLAQRFPAATRHDAGDSVVMPGLIDAHGHLMNLGFALLRADLVGATSKAEIIERLQAYAATVPADAWIIGRGWDQNDWPEKDFPTAADLDAAFPDRPVWLERVDGHAGWGNTAAMRAAEAKHGKTFDGDWQVDGGRILRDGEKATGVFIDAAAAFIDAAVPAPSEALREEAFERALAAAAASGLTGVHDMGVSRADLALYTRFADEGRLSLRVEAYADGDRDALADRCAQGPYVHDGGRLAMRGVKVYMDGALGSRGAALIADYSDEPGHRGLLLMRQEALDALLAKVKGCGLQAATHAIGDLANRLVLDGYAKVLGPDAATVDHRWRIEHAQVVSPKDLPRFAELGVIASMQPTHATSDMPWAEARVGAERIRGAYAWKTLRDGGARLALGSDFPVESVDPRLGLYSAVTRQDLEGLPLGGWQPQERLTMVEALAGFTADAAFANRREGDIGRLAEGYRADFVVLDADPSAIDALAVPKLVVRSTWVDGAPVYQRPADSAATP